MSKTARNTLVVAHLPLVGYLVSELCGRATHLSRDDLASAGALALITSAESFNPDLGVPFGSYARRRIMGAFADELRSNDWASRGARRRITETLAVTETLTAALGRTPAVEELAAALGVDRETALAGLADASRVVSSLDDGAADSLIADTALPEESLLSQEKLTYLRAAVEVLPHKMRYIVEQIYFADRAVKELAGELGITHSAVSQQRAEACRLLRDGLETHYADETGPARVPSSRVGLATRSTYLSKLAQRASAGMAEHLSDLSTEHVDRAERSAAR